MRILTAGTTGRRSPVAVLVALGLVAATLLAALPEAGAQVPRFRPGSAQSQGSAQPAQGAAQTQRLQGQGPALTPGPAQGPRQFKLNMNAALPEEIEYKDDGRLVTLAASQQALHLLLTSLARSRNLNLVTGDDAAQPISIELRNVPWETALTAITSVAGYTWSEHNGIIHVTRISANQPVSPQLQGRRVHVIRLDYTLSADLEPAVQGLLSPVGNVFSLKSNAEENRQTTEALVIEDLPEYIQRIRDYVVQVDQPPRQVLIEVRVLRVELKDDNRQGVNFRHLASLGGHQITLGTTGLANTNAPQAFFAQLNGGNMEAFLDMMATTTDAKTLAAPRVLVVNGQLAHIQVGEQLGFRVTTTTETSTLEGVEFLNVGVVLDVTPRISADNRVLLNVRPKVSSGQVNPETGLPEEETAEVNTNVLLNSGEGIVIGGLIQEQDSDVRSKVSGLGDLLHIGKLFQRKIAGKSRSEIIISLIPRVLPYNPCFAEQDEVDFHRTTTPLLHGPLCRMPRPWEPSLPNCDTNPRPLRLPRVKPLHRCRAGHGEACRCGAVHRGASELPASGSSVLPNFVPQQAPQHAPQHAPSPHPTRLPAGPAPRIPDPTQPPRNITPVPLGSGFGMPSSRYPLPVQPAGFFPIPVRAR